MASSPKCSQVMFYLTLPVLETKVPKLSSLNNQSIVRKKIYDNNDNKLKIVLRNHCDNNNLIQTSNVTQR